MSNELDLNMLRKLIGLPAQVSEQQVNEEKCEECGMDPCTCDHVEEAAKPDFLDVDKDGDKKEPMKKALKDKEVKEGSGDAPKHKDEDADDKDWDDAEEKEELDECGEMPMMSPMSAVGDTDAMAAVIAPDAAAPEQMAAQEEPAEEPASYTLSIRNGDSTLNMTTDSPDEIIHVMKLAGVKGQATVTKGAPAAQEEKVAEEWENTPDATGEREPREFGDIRDWGRKGQGASKPGYKGTQASGDNPLSEEALIGEYKSFKM